MSLLDLKNKIVRKYRFGVIMFYMGNWVFKFFAPPAKFRMKLEWSANLKAQKDSLWKDTVIPLKKIPFGFLMPYGEPAKEKDISIIENFIVQRLDSVSKSASLWVNAVEAVDSTVLKVLEKNGLQEKKSKFIVSKLQSFKVPYSSSHGDFYMDNIVFIKGKLYLIDWSLYSAESSIIFDIMHLPLRQICKKEGISWIESQLKKIPMWDMLAGKINSDVNNLRMLYAVDRTERELRQKGSNYSNSDLKKYVLALDKAISKFG